MTCVCCLQLITAAVLALVIPLALAHVLSLRIEKKSLDAYVAYPAAYTEVTARQGHSTLSSIEVLAVGFNVCVQECKGGLDKHKQGMSAIDGCRKDM